MDPSHAALVSEIAQLTGAIDAQRTRINTQSGGAIAPAWRGRGRGRAPEP